MTLIIINLIFYSILAAFRPKIPILLLIFALPSYLIRFSIIGIPLTLLESMILISFFFFIVTKGPNVLKGIKNKLKNKKKYPFRFEIIAILIISYLAVAISSFSLPSLGIWKAYFFEPIILFILILNYFQLKNDWKKIIWSLTLSALFVSIIAIFQKITGAYIFNSFWANEVNRRVVSIFGYPNAIGLYLAPIILLSVGLLNNYLQNIKKLKNKLLSLSLIFIIILSILSVYFAHSEGGLIAIFSAILIYLFIYNFKTRLISGFLIIITVLSLFLIPSAHDYAQEKFLLQDKSGQIRISQWKETWEMLKENKTWIFGAGLNNYQNKITPHHKDGIFIKDYNDPDWLRKTLYNKEFRQSTWQPLEIYLYPHNIILNFWVELGLLGVIAFMFLFIKIYIKAFKYLNNNYWRPLSASVIGAISAIVIHGTIDVPYFKNDLSAMFWVIIALLSLMIIHNKKNGKTTNNQDNS